MVKQSKLCFSTVHTPNVSLHISSASRPAAGRQLHQASGSSGERPSVNGCSTRGLTPARPTPHRISKLSVAAGTQVRRGAATGHQPTVPGRPSRVYVLETLSSL